MRLRIRVFCICLYQATSTPNSPESFMKITLTSHLNPNRRFPVSGTFIREYHKGISSSHEVHMLVPALKAPPFTEKRAYAKALIVF